MENKLSCDVCGKEAIGVASSSLGPVSLAYCKECAKEGREPYNMLVSSLDLAGICKYSDLEGHWFKHTVDVTLDFFNKSTEDLDNDLEKERIKMNEQLKSLYENTSIEEKEL